METPKPVETVAQIVRDADPRIEDQDRKYELHPDRQGLRPEHAPGTQDQDQEKYDGDIDHGMGEVAAEIAALVVPGRLIGNDPLDGGGEDHAGQKQRREPKDAQVRHDDPDRRAVEAQ